jgi:hypothetical protein
MVAARDWVAGEAVDRHRGDAPRPRTGVKLSRDMLLPSFEALGLRAHYEPVTSTFVVASQARAELTAQDAIGLA